MKPIIQTDRELAEMIARFRTPPGMNWKPLADDIETVLKSRPRIPDNVELTDIEKLAAGDYTLCDGYCNRED